MGRALDAQGTSLVAPGQQDGQRFRGPKTLQKRIQIVQICDAARLSASYLHYSLPHSQGLNKLVSSMVRCLSARAVSFVPKAEL